MNKDGPRLQDGVRHGEGCKAGRSFGEVWKDQDALSNQRPYLMLLVTEKE